MRSSKQGEVSGSLPRPIHITSKSWVGSLIRISTADNVLTVMGGQKVDGWSCKPALIAGVEAAPGTGWSSLARSQRATN